TEAPSTDFFMLPNLVLSLVERILNQALKLDTSLSGKLAAVKHQRLVVDVRGSQLKLLLVFSDKQLHLYSATSDTDA
ncbi:SCP2 sterol-binding domain-containing protein, partial [Pseudoalteromonas sp. CAL107-MNA-CIBAN-0098]